MNHGGFLVEPWPWADGDSYAKSWQCTMVTFRSNHDHGPMSTYMLHHGNASCWLLGWMVIHLLNHGDVPLWLLDWTMAIGWWWLIWRTMAMLHGGLSHLQESLKINITSLQSKSSFWMIGLDRIISPYNLPNQKDPKSYIQCFLRLGSTYLMSSLY